MTLELRLYTLGDMERALLLMFLDEIKLLVFPCKLLSSYTVGSLVINIASRPAITPASLTLTSKWGDTRCL